MKNIEQKIIAGERIERDEALMLYEKADTLTLGALAHRIKERLHPEKTITYIVDRNINYTNICISKCRFCAFHRDPDSPEGYLLDSKTIYDKIEETLALGGIQILLQGGLHPGLSLEYYEEMLAGIKKNYAIWIHGFSPPEVVHLSTLSGLSIRDVLLRLIQAGLDSMPGGGAEILVDRVRQKVSPNKCSAVKWLEVMKTAHELGLRTTATMMFGHIETNEERLEHIFAIRELQDITSGFTAFIPWPFQPGNTGLSCRKTGGVDYLRTLAVSRIILDNVPNIQASWVTQGPKVAQISLAFGANDMGSTMIEENLVAAAGISVRLPEKEIIRIVKDAGYKAVRRNMLYDTDGIS
jgi:cyclic dehypoxanthinyl futalosine synthase